MRILMVTPLYPPVMIGGAELAVQNMTRGLMAQGHEVFVVALQQPRAKAEPDETSTSQVKRIPLANVYWPFATQTQSRSLLARACWHLIDTSNPVMADRLEQHVREVNPDIICTHNLQGFSTGILPALAKSPARKVHVLHDCSLLCLKGALFRNGKRCDGKGKQRRCLGCAGLTRMRRHHLEHIDLVVGVSQAIIDIHKRYGLFTDTPCQVVHNSVRVDLEPILAAEVGHADRPFTFGFLGRVEAPKGAGTLAAAATMLTTEPINIVAAGTGSSAYMAKLASQAPDLQFTGHTDPKAFFDKVDALVMPSASFEAFSGVIVEAFSQAKPVIATRCGGPEELVTHGETGYLVPRDDPSALAAAMRCMAGLSPNQYLAMADAARHQAANFCLRSQSQRLSKLFTGLLAQRR